MKFGEYSEGDKAHETALHVADAIIAIKDKKIADLKEHINCLKSELEEAQKADFKINHDSDRVVIRRDAEPIDIAAALIHSDWINLGDLQEIAEHLQAAYKNSWGE